MEPPNATTAGAGEGPTCALGSRHCVPCEGGVPRLSAAESTTLLAQLSGFRVEEERLRKEYRFGSFVEAMRFVNRLAEVCEAEGHHADFAVHYAKVDVTLWTHAIAGLSENDFILAAKLEEAATITSTGREGTPPAAPVTAR